MNTSMLRKRIQSKRGQVIVLVALLMVPILGMVGIAVDSGFLFSLKRSMQTAADSAALAGSQDKINPDSDIGSVTDAALNDAALNGFTGDPVTTIQVNSPPTSGDYQTNDFVEVIITKTQDTFFLRALSLLGVSGVDNATVTARAVAGAGEFNECIWATSTSANPALTISGQVIVNIPSCGIYVRSSATADLGAMNNTGTVTAQSIDVVGMATGTATNPAANNGAAMMPDPLAGLTAPTYTATTPCIAAPPPTGTVTNASTSTNPYCSITFRSGTLNPNGSASTYYIRDSLTLNAADRGNPTTITANGVTFFVGLGATSLGQSGTITITAPTTSTNPYNGIAIFSKASGTTNAVSIGTGQPTAACKAVNGIVYAPSTQIQYKSTNCTTAPQTILVGDTINIAARAQFGTPTIVVKRRGRSHIVQ